MTKRTSKEPKVQSSDHSSSFCMQTCYLIKGLSLRIIDEISILSISHEKILRYFHKMHVEFVAVFKFVRKLHKLRMRHFAKSARKEIQNFWDCPNMIIANIQSAETATRIGVGYTECMNGSHSERDTFSIVRLVGRFYGALTYIAGRLRENGVNFEMTCNQCLQSPSIRSD